MSNYYLINDGETTRKSRAAPSPFETVEYLAEVGRAGKLRWIIFDGEVIRSDKFTPGQPAKFISYKRKSQ